MHPDYLSIPKCLENNEEVIRLTKKFNECEDRLVELELEEQYEN